MAGFLDRIQVIIDSKFDPSGFVKAGGASAGLSTQQQGLIQRLTQSKGALLTWGAAGAGAGALVATGALAAAKEFADLGVEVRTVQRATGDSAETASRWVAVGDDFGITAQQIARSFAFMGRAVANGTVDLSRWGAEVVLNEQGNVDMRATIESVSEAYNRQADDAQRAALVQAAFGRSGRDLLPILEEGREGIRAMFAAVPDDQILSQQEIDNARRFKLMLDDVEDALREIAITVGSEVAPALSGMGEGIAGIVRGTKDIAEASGADIFGTLWDLGPIGQFSAAADGVGKIIDGDIVGGLERIVEKGNPFGAAATGAKELFSSGFDADAMVRRLARSEEEAERKTRGHLTARLASNAAIRDAKNAITEFTTGIIDVEAANLRVEAAIQSYNEAVISTGPASLEARQAGNALQQSILDAALAASGGGTNMNAFRDTVTFLAGTLAPGSPAQAHLLALIDKITRTEGTHVGTVDVDTGPAHRKMDELEARFNKNYNIGVTIAEKIVPDLNGDGLPG